MNLDLALQKATLAARPRTGDPAISVATKAGEFQLQRITYQPGSPRPDIEPLSPWLPPEEVIIRLDRMGTPMTAELRAFKHSAALSRETLAFTADLYLDGIKTAHLRNDGGGGSTRAQPYQGQNDRLRAFAKQVEALPPATSEFFPEGLPMTLDFWLDLEAGKLVEGATYRRQCKKHVLFQTPEQALKGEYYTLKNQRPTPAVRAYLAKTYPTAQILNDTHA